MKQILLLLAFVGALSAQTFEVSSVREITDFTTLQSIKSGDITYKGGNLYMKGVTLGYAVQWAFDIQNYQLDATKFDWINWRPANNQPRYEIVAKADPSTPIKTARLMALNMLVERFGLKYHTETQQKPGWTLQEDAHGLKIERIAPTDTNPHFGYDRKTFKASFTNMNIEELCGDIALTIREPVVNGTSLGTQTFNASTTVQWDTPDEMTSALFAGLKHDIGLVAVRGKVPVNAVVVDFINQHPTDN
jgi:uncharacterized protein (TIGR03435 family)